MSSKIGTVTIDILANTAKLVKGMDTAEKKVDRVIGNMKKTILSLGTAYVAFEAIDKGVESFIKLEDAQIGVAKTTGLAGAELDNLFIKLNTMSTTMAGLELHGLYDVAEAAGQLGITGAEDISEFTRVIGMVGLTTELSAQGAATSFAKLSNSLGEPIGNMETLASVANELSNTTSANVGDLLQFSQRLSGGAKTAGLMTDEIFGLSATMTDLAINFETGGTNVNRVMLDIVSDSNKFAEAIGEDFESFSDDVQNEPIIALKKLLEHMQGLSKTDAANFLTDLGYSGTEVKDVLLKLSSNTDLLTRNLKIAHDEYGTGTSIMKEYETSAKSLSAQLTKSSAMVDLAFANFGSAFKEPILAMSEMFLEFSEQTNAFFTQFKNIEDLNTQKEISLKLIQKSRDLKELEGTSTTFWYNNDKKLHNQKIQDIKDEIALLEKKSKKLNEPAKKKTELGPVYGPIENPFQKTSNFDEYGIPKEAEKDLQAYTDAKIAATKRMEESFQHYTNLQIEATQRKNDALDEAQSNLVALNDTMIAATGTNYDKWLNDTNKQMLDMADNGASAEQMMQVFNGSLSDFEQTGVDDMANSMDSILDAQLRLAESGLDWGNSLEGVAKQINNVSKAVTQSYVGKLKYEKEDIKLQNKYAKAYLKADGDVSKQKALGAQFDKDQAVLKEANNSAEMAAYANLAGAMGSAYEDGTNGAIAFAAVQSALGIASSWTAIAQAWALPFPANIPAAAMVAANVMPIIDQLGGSGGGGGSSSSASSFDVNRETIENTYDPITDRLDRQIELLEQLNFAGTASAVKVELATETFNRDYKLFVEDTIQGMGTYLRPHWFGYHTSGDSAEFMRSIQGAEDTTGIDIFNSYGLTDESAQIYQRYDNDIVRLNGDALRSGTNMLEFLEYVSANQDIYLTAWISDIDGVLNEYFNITSEYVQSMLSVVDEMQGASDTFKEVYDQISGTNRYEKEKLRTSFGEVDSLAGVGGLEAYLVEQIEAIDGLSEVFNQNVVDLFLSEDPTMLSEQIDALVALSDATGIAFEAGVEDALNYIESIELVGEAMATSTANIKQWEDSSKTNNELAVQMGAALGVTVANTFDELDGLFTQLSNDAFGLTDEEFSFLEANKDLLEETQSIFSDTLGSMVDTLTSASENIYNTSAGLRSNALGSTFGIESYYASMSETKSLLSEGNYDAFSESLNKTIGYSSALSDANNYTSTRDMQFNQLVAANQFDALDVQVSDELTTLKTISETILTQVDQNEKLLDVTEQQAEEIRTMRKEIQDQSVLIAELGVTG